MTSKEFYNRLMEIAAQLKHLKDGEPADQRNYIKYLSRAWLGMFKTTSPGVVYSCLQEHFHPRHFYPSIISSRGMTSSTFHVDESAFLCTDARSLPPVTAAYHYFEYEGITFSYNTILKSFDISKIDPAVYGYDIALDLNVLSVLNPAAHNEAVQSVEDYLSFKQRLKNVQMLAEEARLETFRKELERIINLYPLNQRKLLLVTQFATSEGLLDGQTAIFFEQQGVIFYYNFTTFKVVRI